MISSINSIFAKSFQHPSQPSQPSTKKKQVAKPKSHSLAVHSGAQRTLGLFLRNQIFLPTWRQELPQTSSKFLRFAHAKWTNLQLTTKKLHPTTPCFLPILLQTKHKSRCRIRWPSGCIGSKWLTLILWDRYNLIRFMEHPQPQKVFQWIIWTAFKIIFLKKYIHFMGKNKTAFFFWKTKFIAFHFHLWIYDLHLPRGKQNKKLQPKFGTPW